MIIERSNVANIKKAHVNAMQELMKKNKVISYTSSKRIR